jgi:hypothetical protein
MKWGYPPTIFGIVIKPAGPTGSAKSPGIVIAVVGLILVVFVYLFGGPSRVSKIAPSATVSTEPKRASASVQQPCYERVPDPNLLPGYERIKVVPCK